VGDVFGFWNSRLLYGEAGYKFHLCVCEKNLYYLFICTDQGTDDYEITPDDCSILSNEESYLSFSGVPRIQDIPKQFNGPSRVSDEYLLAMAEHVAASRYISHVNKRKIIPGVERHLRILILF